MPLGGGKTQGAGDNTEVVSRFGPPGPNGKSLTCCGGCLGSGADEGRSCLAISSVTRRVL